MEEDLQAFFLNYNDEIQIYNVVFILLKSLYILRN